MVENVSAWLHALAHYDQGTYWHSLRTANYFLRFMDYLGLRGQSANYICASAALHDIGKLAIPHYILQKKGKLSDGEYLEIKKHPELAFEWMSLLRDPDELVGIPYLHHERWDGSGYPLGLRGAEIPYQVRLFSVIDVWDAMSVNRPYREALPQAATLGHIARSSGILFDPEAVDAFLAWRKKASGDSCVKPVYPAARESGKVKRLIV